MDKVIMLGTGNGGTLDLYNTCFVIQNENGNFLIDTGGGIEIIKRLKQLNIYCNDVVYEAIKEVSKHILPEKLMNAIYEVCEFIILKDEDEYTINGLKYTFFDIKAKGTKQFGFECFLNNKRFIFLGDETLNSDLYDKVKGADYVTHEAFCLDEEENIFHAYEKHHSTALSVAKIMNQLDVKNLILYHTEDSHIKDRKQLYTKEAQSIFNGNVIVPNDLEEIEID